MIHDILLCCSNLYPDKFPLDELVSDVTSKFMHPCERKILRDIMEIIKVLREVARFAKLYGRNFGSENTYLFDDDDEPLQKGLYVNALAKGLDSALDDYYDSIAQMEKLYVNSPRNSLLFVYEQLEVYEPLLLFLRKLIRGIRSRRLHGGAIIQYLHYKIHHGDKHIYKAIRSIQGAVNVVFLKQLTHWLLYAKTVDTYGEFFIQCALVQNASGSDKGTNFSRKSSTDTIISNAVNSYTDIWHYNIEYDYLPHFFTSSWAEKVLFIGQTVLIFKVDINKNNGYSQGYKTTKGNTAFDNRDVLWNGKENEYFSKIQALQNDSINFSQYEHVIEEIKTYVTGRLSEIAVNQSDLLHQLKLIKEYFLLGKGELFLEFIRQTYAVSRTAENENKIRGVVKCFEKAALRVGAADDLEKFSLHLPKSALENENVTEFTYVQHVELRYKINWPLHLLFSPVVIERYNQLFRFLLLIKKMQFELHMIWCRDTRDTKKNETQNIQAVHLRNQLIFFVDNLQYYIQADVLESNFNVLLNTVLNKADLEQIQRSHSVFQANILSLCFLLVDKHILQRSMQPSTNYHSNNPIFSVLNDILNLCEDFCGALDQRNSKTNNIQSSIDDLDKRFTTLIEQLINLLLNLKAVSSTNPLSQLLLRLDFNHWFSSKRKIAEEKG